MKTLRNINLLLVTLVWFVGLTLNFNGCSEPSPLQLGENEPSDSILNLAKESVYPQYASRTVHYLNPEQGYEGGNVNVPGGSTLHFKEGTLTPPPDTPNGADVTLTMLIERDTTRNELLFTLGPSGCQFDPPAEMWFDWSDLGISNPKLYYIDADGNYIEQQPDYIDFRGNKILLYIDHFSRYAVGWD